MERGEGWSTVSDRSASSTSVPAKVRKRSSWAARKKKKKYLGLKLALGAVAAGALLFFQCAPKPAGKLPSEALAPPIAFKPPFRMNAQLVDLEKTIKLQADQPRLRIGVFVIEPDSGRYADINGHESFAAASMIKIPVLVALLAAVDKRQCDMNCLLTLRPELMAGGSGYLQWRPANSQVSLLEAAQLMITNSDNTATNLIIDLLGGTEVLNRQFTAWGLRQTKLAELLPDFPGLNKTSPYDLAYLLALVNQGGLLSESSRQFMLTTMEKTRIRTLLPPGLGVGARIAHKTGDIGCMVGDAGIVTSPQGKRYLVVAQVERPHNDRRANELIRQVSRTIYAAVVPNAMFAPEEKKSKAPALKPRRRHRHRHHA